MKVVLATGIYPPEIGGPSTYAYELAKALREKGVAVTVVTYGVGGDPRSQIPDPKQVWNVVCVSKKGGPVCRWRRYSKALRQHGSDADAVIAFSLVSCGVPLWLAGLKRPRTTRATHSGVGAPPKTLLRLGGDFLWERYTDRGGRRTLREFYEHRTAVYWFIGLLVRRLLRTFDHIVFSTRFQEEMYEQHYTDLPPHSVIENAIPTGLPRRSHTKPGSPFKLLFMGRFVGFKNLPALLEAMSKLDGVTLTMVGDGPIRTLLITRYPLSVTQGKVRFLEPVHGEEKLKLFVEHDLLVLPSLTEISPNVALEARASGLPVLLTKETGLSEELRQGMVVRDCTSAENVAAAIREVLQNYDTVAAQAAQPPLERDWKRVAEEYVALVMSS